MVFVLSRDSNKGEDTKLLVTNLSGTKIFFGDIYIITNE